MIIRMNKYILLLVSLNQNFSKPEIQLLICSNSHNYMSDSIDSKELQVGLVIHYFKYKTINNVWHYWYLLL